MNIDIQAATRKNPYSTQYYWLKQIIETCRARERNENGKGVAFLMDVINPGKGEKLLMRQSEIDQLIVIITNYDAEYEITILDKTIK